MHCRLYRSDIITIFLMLIFLRHKMRPVATPVVAWSVCLSDALVSPAKTAEPIAMLLWLLGSGGPKEPCVRWGSGSPYQWGNFEVQNGPGHNEVKRPWSVSNGKSANSVEIAFGVWMHGGSRNRVIDGGPDPHVERGTFGRLMAPWTALGIVTSFCVICSRQRAACVLWHFTCYHYADSCNY